MRASFRQVYGIADPAALDYDEFVELLWAMPTDTAAMRAFRSLLDEEGADGQDGTPMDGPSEARQWFDRFRARKAGRKPPTYKPWQAFVDGPLANDTRIDSGSASVVSSPSDGDGVVVF